MKTEVIESWKIILGMLGAGGFIVLVTYLWVRYVLEKM